MTLIKVTDVPAAARLLTAVAVALLTVPGSGGHPNPGALLWLPADARIELDAMSMKAGPSVDQDGSAAVVFTMNGPNRQKFTTALIEHFELAAGWRQRAHQWLNPHLATSFSAGWRGICGCIRSIDDHGKPVPRRVYEWIGEWEDTHGNIIAYSLMAEGTSFRGVASYTPYRIIRRMPRRTSFIYSTQ